MKIKLLLRALQRTRSIWWKLFLVPGVDPALSRVEVEKDGVGYSEGRWRKISS